MFLRGSTPQLGFDEQDACLRPQACQLHEMYEWDLREYVFVVKRFHFPSTTAATRGASTPLRERGTLGHGCGVSPTVTRSMCPQSISSHATGLSVALPGLAKRNCDILGAPSSAWKRDARGQGGVLMLGESDLENDSLRHMHRMYARLWW
jgi:hypothetical protein